MKRRCLFEQCMTEAAFVGPSFAADGTYVTYACAEHVDGIRDPRSIGSDTTEAAS